ncbi:MAG TPA: hypothetical protein VMY37_15260 [Thermoguttaceae bacterium]|nr:hypothetical protein [Thermoguttaceae bacterium]
MKVATYEGVVENGQVRLPAGVTLPEKAKVYVVIPGVFDMEVQPVVKIASPRLVHPEQAADFVKEVVEEKTDAGL